MSVGVFEDVVVVVVGVVVVVIAAGNVVDARVTGIEASDRTTSLFDALSSLTLFALLLFFATNLSSSSGGSSGACNKSTQQKKTIINNNNNNNKKTAHVLHQNLYCNGRRLSRRRKRQVSVLCTHSDGRCWRRRRRRRRRRRHRQCFVLNALLRSC